VFRAQTLAVTLLPASRTSPVLQAQDCPEGSDTCIAATCLTADTCVGSTCLTADTCVGSTCLTADTCVGSTCLTADTCIGSTCLIAGTCIGSTCIGSSCVGVTCIGSTGGPGCDDRFTCMTADTCSEGDSQCGEDTSCIDTIPIFVKESEDAPPPPDEYDSDPSAPDDEGGEKTRGLTPELSLQELHRQLDRLLSTGG
jgi:hypothetical protein